MIYKILLAMAIIIFIFNFINLPIFFNMEPENTGTFIGLIMLSITIGHILDRVHYKRFNLSKRSIE